MGEGAEGGHCSAPMGKEYLCQKFDLWEARQRTLNAVLNESSSETRYKTLKEEMTKTYSEYTERFGTNNSSEYGHYVGWLNKKLEKKGLLPELSLSFGRDPATMAYLDQGGDGGYNRAELAQALRITSRPDDRDPQHIKSLAGLGTAFVGHLTDNYEPLSTYADSAANGISHRDMDAVLAGKRPQAQNERQVPNERLQSQERPSFPPAPPEPPSEAPESLARQEARQRPAQPRIQGGRHDVPQEPPEQGTSVSHEQLSQTRRENSFVVRKGDTYWSIARRAMAQENPNPTLADIAVEAKRLEGIAGIPARKLRPGQLIPKWEDDQMRILAEEKIARQSPASPPRR